MITPDCLDSWRRTAKFYAVEAPGQSVGKMLTKACDEIEGLQDEVDRTVRQASDHIGGALRRLEEVEADRDRARDAAVALEQQLAEIERIVHMGGQSDSIVRQLILHVFEEARRP